MSTRPTPRKIPKPVTLANGGAILKLRRELALRRVSAMGLIGDIAVRFRWAKGRPSDPAWAMRRLVPFQPKVWAELKRQAALLRAIGTGLSPAQLAAMLLERGVRELGEDLERRGCGLPAAPDEREEQEDTEDD